MANPRSAWGIDIGNRALKAIKLVRDPAGALRVEDFEVIEHETPLSSAGDNRDSLVQSALANFVQKHPARGATASVSVSGSSSLARFIKLPPVEPRQIPGIVKFEAIQQIPFPLEDVEWSYQLFHSPDSPDVEVGIFAMRKELVNAHMKFFTDVGLSVECVQLNPLAVYNAMFYDERLKGPTMVIDLGSENTDLIISDGETIWLRSIPIGGKSFTEILVKQFKLPFAKAEELKRTAATSKYAKQIFQAMRPVFADLVAEVQRSIGFYASVHRESRIKKVIALGGTFRLPGLQKYLQQNLQLEVTRVDGLAAGGPADAKSRTVFDENLLSLASAYGLAIQAMGDAKITSSLLPEHIRREKLWKDKLPIFAAAAAAFVVGTGVAMGSYFYQKFQYDQNATYREKSEAILRTGQKLDADWKTKVEKEGAGDRQRIINVRSMLNYRDLWPNLLVDIYGALPLPDPILRTGNWDQIKAKMPRKARKTLAIDDLSSLYVPDLGRALGAASADPGAQGGGSAGGALASMVPKLPPNTVPPTARGFMVTMNLVTPYGGDAVDALRFVEGSFLNKLRKMKDKTPPNKEYSLVWAEVTRFRLVGQDEQYMGKLRLRQDNWQKFKLMTEGNPPSAGAGPTPPPAYAPPPPGGVFGTPGGVFGQPRGSFSPGPDNVPYPGGPGQRPAVGPNGLPLGPLDPNTGEDMSRDTVFQVTAVVILNDPDAPAADATGKPPAH